MEKPSGSIQQKTFVHSDCIIIKHFTDSFSALHEGQSTKSVIAAALTLLEACGQGGGLSGHVLRAKPPF